MGYFFPTDKSLRKIQLWIYCWKESRLVTAKAFLGILNHTFKLVPMGRLHLRPLQFYLKCFGVVHTESLDKNISQKEIFFHLLYRWDTMANPNKGSPLHLPEPDIMITTDASSQGCGGVYKSQTAKGMWTQHKDKAHINLLEMKAVIHSISESIQTQKRKQMCTDYDRQYNGYVIHKKARDSHSLHLFQLTQELFQWCLEHYIDLRMTYIPGHL